MSDDEAAYICQCGFCEEGLLRFMRCQRCDEIAAVCDECELVWDDIAEVSEDPAVPSAAAFPSCPACGAKRAKWTQLEDSEIDEAELTDFVAGYSS